MIVASVLRQEVARAYRKLAQERGRQPPPMCAPDENYYPHMVDIFLAAHLGYAASIIAEALMTPGASFMCDGHQQFISFFSVHRHGR